jgi:hypothetical protein
MRLTLQIPVKATAGQAINLLNGDQQNSSPKWSFIKHSQPELLTRVRSRFNDTYLEGGVTFSKEFISQTCRRCNCQKEEYCKLTATVVFSQHKHVTIRRTHMATAELKIDASRATNEQRIETSSKSIDILNGCGYQHYTWSDCTCFAVTQSLHYSP